LAWQAITPVTFHAGIAATRARLQVPNMYTDMLSLLLPLPAALPYTVSFNGVSPCSRIDSFQQTICWPTRGAPEKGRDFANGLNRGHVRGLGTLSPSAECSFLEESNAISLRRSCSLSNYSHLHRHHRTALLCFVSALTKHYPRTLTSLGGPLRTTQHPLSSNTHHHVLPRLDALIEACRTIVPKSPSSVREYAGHEIQADANVN
jgi:hypothetical protein